jgi:hypothetical protein
MTGALTDFYSSFAYAFVIIVPVFAVIYLSIKFLK